MRETEQIVGIILKKDCFNNDFNDKSLIKDSGKGIVEETFRKQSFRSCRQHFFSA